MITDPQGCQKTQSELTRSVAQAVIAMLAAQDRFNRLQEDELLRGRYDPEARVQRDSITEAARSVRVARIRARFARALWWSWQMEHGQADGMVVLR